MAGEHSSTTPDLTIRLAPNSDLHNRFRYQHIETAKILEFCGHGRSLEKVANLIGMSRSAIRRRLKKEGLRVCRDKECRHGFLPNNPKHVQNYCSAACRQRSNRRRNHDWINRRRRKKPLLMTCARPGCGVQFVRKGKSRKLFCTPKCARAVREAIAHPLLTKNCPECGIEFTYKRKKRIFCSPKCKKRAAQRSDRELLRAAKRGAASVPTPAKRGRKRQSDVNRKYFKVGSLVEKNTASGMELTAARRRAAKEMGISYASAALYHKKFRKLHQTRPGTEIQPEFLYRV